MWFKVDDKLHDHPKIQKLLEVHEEDAAAALGLWTMAGSWCGDQLSDGLVSGFVLRRWHPDWKRLAAVLVDVRLWEPEEIEGRPHYRFHDWLKYNDSREKILKDRAIKAVRVALSRDAPLKAAIAKRDKNRCRYCGTAVVWGNQRGPSGATHDHVTPISKGGKNTLENVVTSCRSCNYRKNDRTLKEAGMKLLAPGRLGAPVPDEDAPGTEVHVGSGRVGSGARNPTSTTETVISTDGASA